MIRLMSCVLLAFSLFVAGCGGADGPDFAEDPILSPDSTLEATASVSDSSGEARVITFADSQVALGEVAPSLREDSSPVPAEDERSRALASATGVPVKPIAAADIMAEWSGNSDIKSLGHVWAVECDGKAVTASSLSANGLTSTNLGGSLGSQRFGLVADPFAATKKVLQFRVNVNDRHLWGAPRCEITASPSQRGRLPKGSNFWFGFGLHLPGWQASPDEQIVSQWHEGDGKIPLNPLMALSVKGSMLQLILRHNANSPISKATTTSIVALQRSGLPVSKWSYVVFNARISPFAPDRAFLRMWIDGTLVVNYSGPLGYNYPGGVPYAKVGHYHWLGASNPWPVNIPTRTVLARDPLLVADPLGRYAPQDILSHLQAH